MIKRTTDVFITTTPNELAQEFCNLSDDGQADFFNAISDYSEAWERSFCFQLQYITDCGKLTSGGRHVMELIGQYSEASPKMDFNTAWDDAHMVEA